MIVLLQSLILNIKSSKSWKSGIFLVFASMFANICNLLYSVYLVRSDVISVAEFGVIGLIGSLLNIAQIPLSAYSRSIVHATAYQLGKHGFPPVDFWRQLRRKSITPAIAISIVWLVSIPFLAAFFQTDRLLPFILLTPLWLIGITAAVDSGFLSGVLAFRAIAISLIVEVLVKLLLTVILIEMRLSAWFYIAIPISSITSFLFCWYIALGISRKIKKNKVSNKAALSKTFIASSLLSKFSSVIFLNLDVLLAKHFLSPEQAGQYVFLSFIGKIVYFLGVLFTQFLNPLISKRKGEGRNDKDIIFPIMIITFVINIFGWITFGVFSQTTLFFMDKEGLLSIVAPYTSLYTFAMGCLALASGIVAYYQSKDQHLFSIVGFLFSMLMLIGISFRHNTMGDVVLVVSITAILYLLGIIFTHKYKQFGDTVLRNLRDAVEGFLTPLTREEKTKPSVLILNWRDTKHVWAGGSEVYLHEIAKRLVDRGYKVTMFCGNDQRSVRNQVIDGVQMVRRGGFYTVYIWASIYYLFAFRGQFDMIIDCENGIPFFSPIYARIPVVLVVHHVHQDVFQKHLWFPFSYVAMFLEKKLMPWIYKDSLLVTVSQSSKKEIVKHKFAESKRVTVIEPGIINPSEQLISEKSQFPSILYFGRLKAYKRVDVIIKAFAKVHPLIPTSRLVIAGHGEYGRHLKQLAKKLNIQEYVEFLGHIPEDKKSELFSSAWVAVHPSSIEGWGITVIEANSFGTPVIGSNVNGLKDSIVQGKTGMLVSSGNVNAFARAIMKLIRNSKERNRMSKEAKQWASTFDWNERVDTLINVMRTTYELALEKKRKRSMVIQGGWND